MATSPRKFLTYLISNAAISTSYNCYMTRLFQFWVICIMLTSLLSILSCNIDSYADDSSLFLIDIQTIS